MLKPKVGVRFFVSVGLGGTKVTIGACESIVKAKVSVGPGSPRPSVAYTDTTCEPSRSAGVVNGDVQATNGSPSTLQKVSAASNVWKENGGVGSDVTVGFVGGPAKMASGVWANADVPVARSTPTRRLANRHRRASKRRAAEAAVSARPTSAMRIGSETDTERMPTIECMQPPLGKTYQPFRVAHKEKNQLIEGFE